MTPSEVQNLITNITSTNVNWTGGNEIKPIIEYINANTAIYGIIEVSTYADLPSPGYGQTPMVGCVLTDGTNNGIWAVVGSTWTQMASNENYQETIGDGSNKTYHITHGLNVDYPSVDIYNISDKMLLNDPLIEVRALDANIVEIYFGTVTPPNVNSKQVIVRR